MSGDDARAAIERLNEKLEETNARFHEVADATTSAVARAAAAFSAMRRLSRRRSRGMRRHLRRVKARHEADR